MHLIHNWQCKLKFAVKHFLVYKKINSINLHKNEQKTPAGHWHLIRVLHVTLSRKEMYKYDQNAHFTLVNVIFFGKLPIIPGVKVLRASKCMIDSTDLCILKVIIYRILQLPQFLLLFLLFLFLLLSQSSFSLFVIIILNFLNITRKKTTLKVG